MERIIGMRTISRGPVAYLALLFPDDLTGNKISNIFIKELTNYYPVLKFRLYTDFKYDSPNPSDNKNHQVVKINEITEKFGGQSEFFRRGAKILDLASGVGNATYRFAIWKQGTEIIGLDKRYSKEKPHNTRRGQYVAVSWENLPFPDNYFTGIMSCEGYPRWNFPSDKDDLIFNELTRVSQINTVLRTTLGVDFWFGNLEREETETNKDQVVRHLTSRGWEVFSRERLVVAKLLQKNFLPQKEVVK